MTQKILTRFLIASTTLASQLIAAPGHNFEVGVGVGSVMGNFNYNYNLSTPLYRNFDIATNNIAGSFALGYQYHFPTNWVLGLEADYLYSDLSRRVNPNYDGVLSSQVVNIESKNAFGAVAKLGYAWDKKFIFSVGAGIESRQFKLRYTVANNADINFNKKSNQTAFAARVGVEYLVRHNIGLGLEWRKAFYEKKTYTNTTATFKFNPRNVDTVLLTAKYKFHNRFF